MLAEVILALTLKVSPNVGQAPLDIVTTVIFEVSAENKEFCVFWESEDVYGVSGLHCQSVDGKHDHSSEHQVVIHALPEGKYSIQASLLRKEDEQSTSPITVIVTEANPE